MTIVRRSTSPFGDLLSLRQAMDRLFEESYVRPGASWSEGALVPMDIYATDDDFVLEAHLPSVKPEEVDITVEGNTLTISGEIRSSRNDENAATILSEIRRGRFTRTMTLPAGLEPDKARATFEDGVLTLRIPKAAQVKPRQIKINSNGHSESNGHSDPTRIESK